MAEAMVVDNSCARSNGWRWVVLAALLVVLFFAMVKVGWIWIPGLSGPRADLKELLEAVRSQDEDRQIAALLELGHHPEFLPDSLPALLEAQLDRKELVRQAARLAIEELSDEIPPHLGPWVESGDIKKFAMGAEAVRSLGSKAEVWTDAVLRGLRRDDLQFKMAALFALQNIGPSAMKGLDRVIELLDDEDFNIVINACRVLSALGPQANRASPKLMTLLPDDGRNVLSVRSMAAETLGSLGPVEGLDIVGALMEKLDSFFLLERERALIGLGRMGRAAAPALPKIKSLMGDSEDPLDRTSRSSMPRAAMTYYYISGDLATTLQVLSKLLDSPSYEGAVMDCLAELGDKAGSLTPGLIRKLDHEEATVREQAIVTLGAIGPAAAEAKSKLRHLAESDEDELIRYAARRTLRKLEKPS